MKHFGEIEGRSGSAQVIAAFAQANSVASLAIASEPWAYTRIFNRLRYSTDKETYRKALAHHRTKLAKIYKAKGEDPVRKAWDHLCHASSALEPNRHVHEILRLAKNDIREKTLKGPLAGALFLKTIAEVLRRTAEDVFSTQWPEEGETWDL